MYCCQYQLKKMYRCRYLREKMYCCQYQLKKMYSCLYLLEKMYCGQSLAKVLCELTGQLGTLLHKVRMCELSVYI